MSEFQFLDKCDVNMQTEEYLGNVHVIRIIVRSLSDPRVSLDQSVSNYIVIININDRH